jgi:hypothetical protein
MILQFHGLHTISKQSLTILILLIISAIAHTQNQNNFWVYGYQAGINFNTNPPSYQGGFSIQASEGAASVADPVSGELLFYTDGVTVWDASNNPMPNGTGLLGGDPVLLSSTTAAVICEKPGSSNQYYLITVDEQASNNGLRYSVVDMALNGGKGDVVAGQKNILILNTTSEKLQVVPLLIITPLTFLGGSFYSISVLPDFWQKVALFNPIVYLISGFRWSFYDVGDVSMELSVGMAIFFLLCSLAIILRIFKTGYHLRN